MHRHSLNLSRFDSFAADHQPIRPERFDSGARKHRSDEPLRKSCPNTGSERRAWSLIGEPFVDEPPVCPRRSVSPKRSTEESTPASQCHEELSKLLSFVLNFDLTNVRKRYHGITLSPPENKSHNIKYDLSLSSSNRIEARGRTPTRRRLMDKTPVYCRPKLSPERTFDQKRQSKLRECPSFANFDVVSSIALPDLDSTEYS
jgi:hypothetical protein